MRTPMEKMRKYVSDMYPGLRWKTKVYFMPDRQVAAIYRSNQRYGDRKLKSVDATLPEPVPYQYTIFDFIGGK